MTCLLGDLLKHPVTGDELSRGEWVAWRIQAAMRRWAFINILVSGSILWWLTGGFGWDPDLNKWNAWASLMALIIESLVGMAMFNQTQRDAVYLRRLFAMEEADLKSTVEIQKDLEHNPHEEKQMSGTDPINLTVTGSVLTAAYTASANDYVLEWSASGGAFAVTLPAASAALVGRPYVLLQTTSSANVVTVKTAGGTINGTAGATGVAQTASKIGLGWAISDGTNWYMELI